jgi:hypothetical protein
MENYPYTIDPEFMDTIKWAVDRAVANELPVVLNIHHYNEIMENPAAHKERFLALWDQISTEFQNHTQNLYFEILNEPVGNLTPALWNLYLHEGLAKIREKNPDRMVIIGTANWGGIDALPQLLLPDDPNIILTIHYYNPPEFTFQGDETVGSYPAGVTWGTTAQMNAMRNDMNIIKQYAEENNVPVYIGEFGVSEHADETSKLLWIGFLRDIFDEYEFSSAYWKYCTEFGIYNHILNCHYPKMIKALSGFEGEMCNCATLIDIPIVTNSTFDKNITPWQFNINGDANARVSVVNEEARIEIIRNGTEDWHIQFIYGSFPLKKGYTYTLTFDAYASDLATILFSIGKNEEDYAYAYYDYVDLTTGKTTFSYTFTYEEETLSRARIAFECGLTNAQYVYFDNVYLYETAPNSIQDNNAALPKCTVKAGGNIFIVEGNSIEAITVYDISGRICYRKKYQHAGFVEIQESFLPSNVGLIQVQTDVKSAVLKNIKGK